MYACYKYNNSELLCTGTYEECREKIDCDLPRDDQRDRDHELTKNQHCFVVFSKENKVLSAGCNQYSRGTVDPCDTNECVGTIKGSIYHCCCSNNLCNKDFKYPPPPPPEIQSPQKPDVKPIPNDGLGSTVVFSVIPIVIIITLVGALILRYKRIKGRQIRRVREINELRNNDDNVTVPMTSDFSGHFSNITGFTGITQNDNSTININGQNNLTSRGNNYNLAKQHQNGNRIDLSSIQLLENIGSGRFGTVHRAMSDNLGEVAVKIASHNDHQCWLNETQIYNCPELKHPNILNFIYSDEHLETDSYWLIVGYASKGSLHTFLKESTINWKEFIHIALGIVRGLSHMHEADIAHRDFKSKNVLLKDDLTPCITDFGVAALLNNNNGSHPNHRKKYLQVGTPRYMAPEVLECSVTFTKTSFMKIDVYAMSLVLWELISRCSNIPVYSAPGSAMDQDYLSNPVESQCLETSFNAQPIDSAGNVELDSSSVQLEPYKLPFEDITGPNPTIDEMRQIVVVDKMRPNIRDEWKKFPASDFERAIRDGWEYDHDARISASCFVERVETLTRYPL